ncbi:MAG: hypothetical protein LUQ64_05210 [Methanomicrobiales archaeon]|nr:hypothetical protein [Methanomicrobiales archaeon]
MSVEDGVTIMEAMALALLILCGAGAVYILSAHGGPLAGAVPAAVQAAGTAMEVAGDVDGLAASDTTLGGIPVRFPQENPRALGACIFTVSPLAGSRGIGMDRATVTWTAGGNTTVLPFVADGPVEGPAWTIVSRSHALPGHTADEDLVLEPGERFELLAVAPAPLEPYAVFTLVIHPAEDAVPLTIRRTVPARVTPVMDLDG